MGQGRRYLEPMNSTQNTESVTCPKCDGRKVVNYGRVYDNRGRRSCFACGGVGTINVPAMTAREIEQVRAVAQAQRDHDSKVAALVKTIRTVNAAAASVARDAHGEAQSGPVGGHAPECLHKTLAALHTLWSRAAAIVDSCIDAGSIRPSQIAELGFLAEDIDAANAAHWQAQRRG